MIAYGIHELQEAGIIPFVIQEIYNINTIFSDKSVTGSIFKSLFGYNGNPSFIEAISYIAYMIGMGVVFKRSQVKTRFIAFAIVLPKPLIGSGSSFVYYVLSL